MTPIREELLAYAKKERTNDQIVRKLMESNEWFALAGFAAVSLGRTKFDLILHPANQESMPVDRLVYFTDLEAAKWADLPVSFIGKISGVDAFSILDEKQHTRLDINYGLPIEQTFFAGADVFPLLRLWATSIRIEQQLRAAIEGAGPVPFLGLRNHPGFVVAVKQENNDWMVGAEAYGESALAFTAPDQFTSYWRQLSPQDREAVSGTTVSGEKLFPMLIRDGLQGLTFNRGSELPITIPAGMFQSVISA